MTDTVQKLVNSTNAIANELDLLIEENQIQGS